MRSENGYNQKTQLQMARSNQKKTSSLHNENIYLKEGCTTMDQGNRK